MAKKRANQAVFKQEESGGKAVIFPKFVCDKWGAERLRLNNAQAELVGAKMADLDPAWGAVRDKDSFMAQYLESFAEDPGVGFECRKALGKGVPPLFALPEEADVPSPGAKASARKCLGYYAACAKAALARGESELASKYAVLELLEYGGMADEAFKLAQQRLFSADQDYAAAARSIQTRAYVLALIEEGLEPAEAEARTRVQVAYSFRLLESLVQTATSSDDSIASLRATAEALADTARNCAAYEQIISAPLGTDSAVALLHEAITIVEAHLQGSEDDELFAIAKKTKNAVSACKVKLIDREIACRTRQQSEQVREVALQASSKADAAANLLAKKACVMANECSEQIAAAATVESNDERAKELFAGIAAAFRGAAVGATQEAKKSAIRNRGCSSRNG